MFGANSWMKVPCKSVLPWRIHIAVRKVFIYNSFIIKAAAINFILEFHIFCKFSASGIGDIQTVLVEWSQQLGF